MLRNRLAGLALIGLATSVAGCGTVDVAQAADEKPAAAAPKETGKNVADSAPEVAFPSLPKGAGKMDDNAPKTFTTTESGLKYRVLRAGTDPKPTARQAVEVHYHGWLDNKKVFDSSYERGETISFGLNQVIPGWTEGMQKVGKGGMIELEIPAKLGYGSRGAGAAVPPNATLHFLVELKDIK
ncbi:putative FKBP-type peptidyl-prolyl cis-trans isomerase [Caulifigura coniformis]|uniref:Peptidyl-prolyl cis-trans isomerase n=1 Tax=Caulifigura coniformis TaxID=2527983 RepID=A0A517SHW9_9PLAN|nr:FKBP-type peptidyl-prolyl cis-trans isomerase [Caulifigura coniformis]QDT55726.1 putative FKBP-type peptidyl-prolyl cis-trans isomerase [Caulifigura coniformis]